jgi:N-terminal acetyltransferase B complex catalytic subunit
MTTIRPFSIFDVFKFNNVNLDILTETYHTNFYGKYLAVWGEYCVSAENSSGTIEGYVLGKKYLNQARSKEKKVTRRKRIGMAM